MEGKIAGDLIKLPESFNVGYTLNPLFFCLADPSSLVQYTVWGATRYQIGAAFQCRKPSSIIGMAFNLVASNEIAAVCRLWNYDGNILLRSKATTFRGVGLHIVYFDEPYEVLETEIDTKFLVSYRPDAGSLTHSVYSPTPAHITDGGSSNLYTNPRCLGDTYYLTERAKRFVNGDTLPTGYASIETWPIDPIIASKVSDVSTRGYFDTLNNTIIDPQWTIDKGNGSIGVITEDNAYLQIQYDPGTTADWHSTTNYLCPKVEFPFPVPTDFEISVFVENVVVAANYAAGGILLRQEGTNANYHRIQMICRTSVLYFEHLTGASGPNVSIGQTYCWLRAVKKGSKVFAYYSTNTFANKPQDNADWTYLDSQTLKITDPTKLVVCLAAFQAVGNPGVSPRFRDFSLKSTAQDYSELEYSNKVESWNYIDKQLPEGFSGSIGALYEFNDNITDLMGNSSNNFAVLAGALRYGVVQGLRGLFLRGTDCYKTAALDSSVQITGDLTIEMLISTGEVSVTSSLLQLQAIGESEDTNTLYALYASDSGSLNMFMERDLGTNITVSMNAFPPVHNLCLLTWVRSGTSHEMYLNGTLVDAQTATNVATGGSSGYLYLGSTATPTEIWPYAIIPSLRIISGAFTEAQVIDSYKRIRGLI